MINHRGIWLPDGEKHLQGWMDKKNHIVNGKPTYQKHKLDEAVSHCRQRRRAVDVGAHCGLFSMHLGDMFKTVEAFEPVLAHRECFAKNVPHGNVNIWDWALGEKETTCSIHTTAGSSGDSFVQGDGEIPVKRMDDCLPSVTDVDFIKLDCEGYELFALRGGEEVIKRCLPVIMVEQKPGKAQKFGIGETAAVDYLRGFGYKLVREMGGDYIMVTG